MTLRLVRPSLRVLLLGLGIGLLGPHVATAQQATATEYEVKAAFIYNFIRFVDWPVERFDSPNAPYLVCVDGEHPFSEILFEVLKNREAKSRVIETKTLDRADPKGSACHVIFGGVPERDGADVAVANHPGVLTVGEGRAFAESGGVIAFTVIDRRVRFAINLKRAEMAGLKISSQLLNLAELVEDAPARGETRDEGR